MAAAGTQGSSQAVDVLFNYLKDLIYNPSHASLDLSLLPEEFLNLGKGLIYYAQCVYETTTFAKDLSRGELDGKMPSRGNEIAAPLKGLQASLKHLTWQTQQVARGDYKQRVSFMGMFADSFNMMIEQLDARREALMAEIEINRKKSEALSQNNSLLETITVNISQWIIMLERETGEWLYINRDVNAVLSCGQALPELYGWLAGQLKGVSEGRTEQTVEELELPGLDGTQYFSVSIHPLQWYERDAVAFVFTDVSGDKRQIHKLETVAYHDPLTRTFNRHYGMETLTKWLEAGQRFVICFVDLDNLKYVNDKFGHAEGDAYIMKVVEIMRMFSNDAVICRLGGDEFMILSRSCGLAEAEAEMERLRNIMVSENEKPGNFYNHSLSYGVVEAAEGETMPASELLGAADEKMYIYKRAHKMQRQETAAPSMQQASGRAAENSASAPAE